MATNSSKTVTLTRGSGPDRVKVQVTDPREITQLRAEGFQVASPPRARTTGKQRTTKKATAPAAKKGTAPAARPE
jgi:hypothetical protein